MNRRVQTSTIYIYGGTGIAAITITYGLPFLKSLRLLSLFNGKAEIN